MKKPVLNIIIVILSVILIGVIYDAVKPKPEPEYVPYESTTEKKWVPFEGMDKEKSIKRPTKDKTVKKSYPTVTVTSIADGYDVKRVNLFSCASCEGRRIVTSCTNGEKVKLIMTSGNYVKVRKSNGKEGWCMEGWIRY